MLTILSDLFGCVNVTVTVIGQKEKAMWTVQLPCRVYRAFLCISVFDLYHQLITILNTMYLVSSVYHG